jgi:hypothetical protein
VTGGAWNCSRSRQFAQLSKMILNASSAAEPCGDRSPHTADTPTVGRALTDVSITATPVRSAWLH